MKTHLIGIGGIGMSALARILLQKGVSVSGSDVADSPLLDELRGEGAEVFVGHSADLIQCGMTVVYSSDIKSDNAELRAARDLHLPLLHRSDLLHQLLLEKKGLLVTGVHGKTTTTSLLAATLIATDFDPSFVIGGILRSVGTNGRGGSGPYFIAEADESDGSFLKTPSFGAIVTNLEDEHMNYWQTRERLDLGFAQFFAQVECPKHLFWCGDDSRLRALNPPGFSYGFSEGVDGRVADFAQTEKGIRFTLGFKGRSYASIELALFGRHNALNGAAVFGLALTLGAEEAAIRKAFSSFAGAKRRLEYKGEAHSIQVFDDYGHHPTEIDATLKALKVAKQENRLVVIFQPHRFTRVRDLFDDFLSCFDAADALVLTDIYGAGEAPIEGVTTERLLKAMEKKLGSKLHYLTRAGLEKSLLPLLKEADVVLTIGAGDVTKVGELLLELLRKGR